MMTDTIADMLTRIRNANRIYRPEVEMPYSKLKDNILKKMKQEGFIKEFKKVEEPPQHKLVVTLKYGPDGEFLIRKIQRISKPGRRVYKGVDDLGKVLSGLGIAIISTSKGVLTDTECRAQKVGGEVLCILH